MNTPPNLQKLITAVALLVLGLSQFAPGTAQADEAAPGGPGTTTWHVS
jgi:hypothetical protein